MTHVIKINFNFANTGFYLIVPRIFRPDKENLTDYRIWISLIVFKIFIKAKILT